MIPIGVLASSLRSGPSTPDEDEYENIRVLNTYSANSGASVNPVITGVNFSAGSSVLVAATVRDGGPTIFEATDSLGNTYELIASHRLADHSVSTALLLNTNTEAVVNGWVAFAASYDDPENGYPLANGGNRVWAVEIQNLAGLAEPVRTTFTPNTPIVPEKYNALTGDLVFSILSGAVTTRTWTPTVLDYTYMSAYRGANMTSQLAYREITEPGMTGPSWDRSGAASNTTVLTARFRPKIK